MTRRIPLTIVYTGNGKGKTTAAMGLVMRTLGHGKDCAVLQFIKSEGLRTGERRFAEQNGVLWENFGEGFLWNLQDEEPTRQACERGWNRAKELIMSGRYELIVLDEFTYPLSNDYVSTGDVIGFLESLPGDLYRPHIVITGRDAPELLMDAADMVHEIVEITHPWRTAAVPAQACIEF
jgi:cob(I)alamin adenosyltransferase